MLGGDAILEAGSSPTEEQPPGGGSEEYTRDHGDGSEGISFVARQTRTGKQADETHDGHRIGQRKEERRSETGDAPT